MQKHSEMLARDFPSACHGVSPRGRIAALLYVTLHSKAFPCS